MRVVKAAISMRPFPKLRFGKREIAVLTTADGLESFMS